MAMLQQLLKKNNLEPFSIIGMAVIDMDKHYSELEKFVRKLDLKFPVLVSDEGLIKDFGGIFSVPTAFLIDKNGMIAQKYVSHLGESHMIDAVNLLKLEK